eukprot:Nitzschia sp. Nitz4//scaffold332_size19022//1104//1895//NITZ4_008737-RA/size19022-processed-gene-0.27-mRNA-1//1//CDS//3329548192//6522//frame0
MRWPFRTQRQQETEPCRPTDSFVEAKFVGFTEYPPKKNKEYATMSLKDGPRRHVQAGSRTGVNTHHGHARHPPRRVACVENEKKPCHSPPLPTVPAPSGKPQSMHCVNNVSNLKPPPPSAPPTQKVECKDESNPTLSPWRRRSSIVTMAGGDELERYQRSHHLGSLNNDEPSSLEQRSHSLPMNHVITQPLRSLEAMNRSTRSCPGQARSKPQETTLEQRAQAYRASCQTKPTPLSSVGHQIPYPSTVSLHWRISQSNQANKM